MNHKRLKRRLIVINLVSVILFCGVGTVKATDKPPIFDELVEAQAQAVAANEALMQYFYGNGWVKEYPEYFSSCYIEDNVLHICLVSPTEQEKAALDRVLENYKDVIVYEYSQYSHSELMEYADRAAKELQKQGCKVTLWCVDSITGNIVIGVLPEDVQTANALINKQHVYARGSTLPKIEIEASEYVVTGDDIREFVTEDTVKATASSNQTVIGGSTIMIDSQNRSAGTCGYYGGSKALISCGHGTTQGLMS